MKILKSNPFSLIAIFLTQTGLCFFSETASAEVFKKDTFQTGSGELIISFIGHGTLMFEYGDKIIHVDPVTREADYSKMPEGDIVLVTHQHGDHLDISALQHIVGENTSLILTQKCIENSENLHNAIVMHNGDSKTADGIMIEAVPAYNIVHERSKGNPFHPKGEGNGYVIQFGDMKIYVAGDTENIPEMKNLQNINVAFLPMNLPYTMTPEMAADAAKSFKPKILYPYHYGNTDPEKLVELLKDTPEIEVRIRPMQ